MIRQALIHAGGEGTRLRPVTYEIPKPLIPVQGRPILSWQLRWFQRFGVERVVVTISPKWRAVFERWKEEVQKEISVTLDLWEEREPMGTMGAMVHHLQERFREESIFVTNGDELKGFDLSLLAKAHLEGGYAATLGLTRVPNPQNYEVAEVEGTKIVRFLMRSPNPVSDLAHAGLYALDTVSIKGFSCEKTFLMFETDFFPQKCEEGKLGGVHLPGPWYDCGTIERWERAIQEWREPLDRSA
jgi:mannose-1-phosphate guanylyltransferase